MVKGLRNWTLSHVDDLGSAPNSISRTRRLVFDFGSLLRTSRNPLGSIRFEGSRNLFLSNLADALLSVVAGRCHSVLDLPIRLAWVADCWIAWNRDDVFDGCDILRDALWSTLCRTT